MIPVPFSFSPQSSEDLRRNSSLVRIMVFRRMRTFGSEFDVLAVRHQQQSPHVQSTDARRRVHEPVPVLTQIIGDDLSCFSDLVKRIDGAACSNGQLFKGGWRLWLVSKQSATRTVWNLYCVQHNVALLKRTQSVIKFGFALAVVAVAD